MQKKLFIYTLLAWSSLSSANDVQGEDGSKAYEWITTLTLENLSNVQGGVERGTRNLANLDVTLAIDTQAADWWQNGKWFVYVLGDYGKNPSELSGDLQTLSNIATTNAIKIYEFWYQHSFVDDSIKVLVGLHDYNSTFYSLDSAGLFSLASFGIGPDTSQAGPSIFSTTSAAVHLTIQEDNFYWLLAAYDGIPGDPNNPHGTHVQFNKGDGVFKASEIGFIEKNQYKFALGGWQQTAHVENPVDGQPIESNHGYYIIGEKYFSEDLVAFFQYGRADDKTNQIDEYWGAGVRLNNSWKENDALGLGAARAHNGLPFLLSNPELENEETIFELTYFLPLMAHVNGQSSLYYIKNPSMSTMLDNALAVGLRLYIDF